MENGKKVADSQDPLIKIYQRNEIEVYSIGQNKCVEILNFHLSQGKSVSTTEWYEILEDKYGEVRRQLKEKNIEPNPNSKRWVNLLRAAYTEALKDGIKRLKALAKDEVISKREGRGSVLSYKTKGYTITDFTEPVEHKISKPIAVQCDNLDNAFNTYLTLAEDAKLREHSLMDHGKLYQAINSLNEIIEKDLKDLLMFKIHTISRLCDKQEDGWKTTCVNLFEEIAATIKGKLSDVIYAHLLAVYAEFTVVYTDSLTKAQAMYNEAIKIYSEHLSDNPSTQYIYNLINVYENLINLTTHIGDYDSIIDLSKDALEIVLNHKDIAVDDKIALSMINIYHYHQNSRLYVERLKGFNNPDTNFVAHYIESYNDTKHNVNTYNEDTCHNIRFSYNLESIRSKKDEGHIMSAVSAIMSRNMDHRLGSHIIHKDTWSVKVNMFANAIEVYRGFKGDEFYDNLLCLTLNKYISSLIETDKLPLGDYDKISEINTIGKAAIKGMTENDSCVIYTINYALFVKLVADLNIRFVEENKSDVTSAMQNKGDAYKEAKRIIDGLSNADVKDEYLTCLIELIRNNINSPSDVSLNNKSTFKYL